MNRPTHYSLAGFLVICSQTSIYAEEEPTTHVLNKAIQAQKETFEQLKSFRTTGTYEVFLKNQDDQKEELAAAAALHIACDNGKFFIDLRVTYETRKKLPHYPRVVILHDGQGIFVVRFSPSVRPTGCSGEIHSNPTGALQLAGFDLRNVYTPWQRMVHVEKLIENVGRDEMAVAQVSDEVTRYSFNVGTGGSRSDFDISAAVDFNVTGRRSFRSDQRDPVRALEAEWRQLDGVWYVAAFTETTDWSFRGGLLERSVVTFDKFETNPKIDANRFDLSTIGIPPRTRFLDRRKNGISAAFNFDGKSLSPR